MALSYFGGYKGRLACARRHNKHDDDDDVNVLVISPGLATVSFRFDAEG